MAENTSVVPENVHTPLPPLRGFGIEPPTSLKI